MRFYIVIAFYICTGMLMFCSTSAFSDDLAQPQLNLQIGQRMFVTSVAYAPDGQHLASGSWDRTVKLWDAHTGEIERTLTGNKYAVNAVAFSPDGKILASAAGWSAMREIPETPGEVILWNVASGERLHTLSDFAHPVSAIAFSPDGQTLATASYRVDAQSKPASSSKYAAKTTRIVQLWDIKTLHVRQTIAVTGGPIGPIAFSPDGQYLAVGTTMFTGTKVTKGKGFTSREDIHAAEIRLYDPATASLQHKMTVAGSSLQSLAFSPDGHTIAAGYGLEQSHNYGPIRLWDIGSGKVQKTLQTGQDTDWGNVTAMTFSSDGKTLTAIKSTLGDFVQVWDVATVKVQSRLSEAYPNVRFGEYTSLAFSPDGKNLAVSGGYINYGLVQLWNVNTRQVQWSNNTPMFRIGGLATTNDGKTLGCNYNQMGFGEHSVNSLQLWDTHSGTLKHSIINHLSFVFPIAFSPDNKLVGAGGFNDERGNSDTDPCLKIWSVADDHLVRTFKPERGASSFVFTPDSSRVVIGDNYQVSLWDMKTGKDLRRYEPNFSVGDSVAISPDGKLIASVGGRGDLGSYGELTVWDLNSGKTLWTQSREKYYIGEVAFSPSGKIIATGHSDGSIGLWNVQTGKAIRTFSAHKDAVAQVTFSPGGQTLWSAGTDGTVKTWDVTTGKLNSTFDIKSPVGNFALTANHRLWTLNNDNLLQAWDIPTGQLLVTIEVLSCSRNAKGYLTTDWIARTPGGYYDASPGAAKYIRWRVGDHVLPAATYAQKYHRPDLIEAALQ